MRCKDRYIGRLYSDIGKVPSDSGIFGSTGELREFVLGLNGPYRKGEKASKGGRTPSHGLVRIGLERGGAPFLPSPFPFPFLSSYSYYMEGLLVLLGKGGWPPCPIRTREGAQASFLLASLLYSRMTQLGPYTPRRIPVTLEYSKNTRITRNLSEVRI